jgi:hypothetical protein
VIVPPQFPYAEDFAEGMARVQLGEQWTYINEAGEMMNKKFDKPFRFMDLFYNFSEGLAVCRVGGAEKRTPDGYNSVLVDAKYGFIDIGGKAVIPVSFDGAGRFTQGLAAIKKGAKWGFIDKTGKLAIPANYDEAKEFTDGLAQVAIQRKWGFINTKGETVVQPAFDEADDFHDGLARIMLAGSSASSISEGASSLRRSSIRRRRSPANGPWSASETTAMPALGTSTRRET